MAAEIDPVLGWNRPLKNPEFSIPSSVVTTQHPNIYILFIFIVKIPGKQIECYLQGKLELQLGFPNNSFSELHKKTRLQNCKHFCIFALPILEFLAKFGNPA
jgi:hypothetical protein